MNEFYYFHSIRKTTIQVLNLFNELRVAKYKPDGSIAKTVLVPIKLGPKDKFVFWVTHQKHHEKRLPIMGLSMTSMAVAQDRITNNVTSISYEIGDEWMKHLNPLPVDINYKLSIASQYMVEMDQMLEQIVPFFNPYVMVRVGIPEFNNFYNVKVNLTGVSQGTTPDVDADGYRMVLWDLDFTVQAYLFQPTKDSGIIEKIITRFYNNPKSFAAMQSLSPSAGNFKPLANFNVVVDEETGVITLSMTAEETLKLNNMGACNWDLVFKSTGGDTYKAVAGNINII